MTWIERGEVSNEDAPEHTVAIVGAGVAGLVAAHEISRDPSTSVVVIEKPQRQSNSIIAGQRYRAGIAGQRVDGAREIGELLSRRSGYITPEMQQFAELAVEELAYWEEQQVFQVRDSTAWFGPQWGQVNEQGRGRGLDVITRLVTACRSRGVKFISAEVHELLLGNSGVVEGLQATAAGSEQLAIAADEYIVAAGGIGGYIFESTNRPIRNSGHELAFRAGIPLEGATVHMFHPFGKTNRAGQLVQGCYETDNLADAEVFLAVNTAGMHRSEEITTMLAEHKAHYHFPRIIELFRNAGGIALLRFPNGHERYAKVALHQTQIGISTEDGIRVKGIDNLYAVGDASSINYWTNQQPRFPGFALAKCLVDARLAANNVSEHRTESRGLRLSSSPQRADVQANFVAEKSLRIENSLFLDEFDAATSRDAKREIAEKWLAYLEETQSGSVTQRDVSREIAQAHLLSVAGLQTEPIPIQMS